MRGTADNDGLYRDVGAQSAGGVDQQQRTGVGPAEEHLQGLQVAGLVVGVRRARQERFDVDAGDQLPARHRRPVSAQELGQVPGCSGAAFGRSGPNQALAWAVRGCMRLCLFGLLLAA